MSEAKNQKKPRTWLGWLVFVVVLAATFGLGILFASIMERREEARPQPRLVEIDRFETDSAEWGKNWPREYASYKLMEDSTTRTKYGGADPRDYLKETPANVVLFAGYGFAKDYLQARGHVHAVTDVVETARTGENTVATCWTCKSPDVPRKMAEFGKDKVPDPKKAGFQELVMAGAGEFYSKNFMSLEDEIDDPIGCLDCHDAKTMQLRVSRPALIEAFERQGRDITNVSHQEMRTLVCAQCHVEYYFKDKTYLTFPWDKGMTPEAMEEYYDGYNFTDWTHAISGTPMIKMQHPDYEIYSTGVHAARNVSCADCHMPYRSEGGESFSMHHLRSPLLDIANSCAVCHRWGEDEIRQRVYGIQDKVRGARDDAEAALTKAHFDVAACMQAGASEEELKPLRAKIRAAQLRWDYVAANNGMGFHSPQECMRILGDATDIAQQCRVEAVRVLARHGHLEPVRYPDFASKDNAQALIQQFVDGQGPNLLGGEQARGDE